MLSFRQYTDAAQAIFTPAAETALFTDLPRIVPSEYETSTIKRDRALKHLLRANHHNHALFYNNNKFHNHIPHVRTLPPGVVPHR